MATGLGTLFKTFIRFLLWWRGQFTFLLPDVLRKHARSDSEFLILDVVSSALIAYRCTGGHLSELARVDLSSPVPETTGDPAPLNVVCASMGTAVKFGDTRVVMRIAASDVLSAVVELPQAALENLRQVLSFEMHRITPFKADDVYFDYKLLSRTPASAPLQVEVSIVRRELVDAVTALLPLWNLKFDGKANLDEVGQHGFFVELAASTPVQRKRNIWTPIVWAVNATLIAALLIVPLQQQDTRLEELQSNVAAAKSKAEAASQLRAQADKLRSDREFLIEQKRHAPALVAILAELTALLPDSTWIHQLDVKQGVIRIKGASAKASALVELIENSRLFSQATFRSPLTQNLASGDEQFELVFEFTSQ